MLAQSFAPSLESLPPTSARVSIAPRSLIASLVYMAAGTDKGRARVDNQDCFIVDPGLGLAVVCDGMGGHAAGDLASKLAARTFAAAVLAGKDQLRDYVDGEQPQVSKREIAELLQLAANTASQAVYQASNLDPEKRGMGTTLVAVLVLNNHAFIVNVGDSRAYLLRDGDLEQLTRDHNVYNELVRRRKLRVEVVKQVASKNSLTRAVGVYEHCDAETLVIDVAEGDRILLCSDGLYRYFEPPEGAAEDLRRQLLEDDDQQVVDALIDSANALGGRDNVTAVVVTIGKVGDYDSRVLSDISTRREALAQSPLFALLDERELLRVLSVTEVRSCFPRQEVFAQGDTGGEVYVVLSGGVSVYRSDTWVADLKVGQHFGEMSLIRDQPRSARAVATQQTELLVIPRDAFFDLLRGEHDLGMKLLWQFTSVLADRLAETICELGSSRTDVDVDIEDLAREVFYDDESGSITLRPASYMPSKL